MTMYAMKRNLLVFALMIMPAVVLAENSDSLVGQLQRDWAVANYRLAGDEQEAAFDALIERADEAVSTNPKSAELLIWNGIIKSSYAGARGGLGALGLAKDARKSLEKALEVDGDALNGSAYTSLGTLYSNVPGWPVGFGSDKKAVQLFEKALKIDPEGIDSNYFYADYLLQHKRFEEAERYLLKAQNAAPRPNRPLADAGRQEEIQAALSVTREKLKRSRS
jgi:tetratricopeptide (TPR) repeat protein